MTKRTPRDVAREHQVRKLREELGDYAEPVAHIKAIYGHFLSLTVAPTAVDRKVAALLTLAAVHAKDPEEGL